MEAAGGDETRDVDLGFHTAAGVFLSSLDGALRQAQLYEPDNRILADPRRRLTGMLEGLVRTRGSFSFHGVDRSVFVNSERLRCDGSSFLRHAELLAFLGERGIGGIEWPAAIRVDDWADSLLAIARFDRHAEDPFATIKTALARKGLTYRVLLKRKSGGTVAAAGGATEPLQRRQFAVRSYVRLMVLLQRYLEHLQEPLRRSYYQLRLQRAVQDLVTVCLEGGWKYFGLVHSPRTADYPYRHAAHVAVLSLMIGARLNLGRARMTELGMSAVLHDLGKSLLPRDLLEKESVFTKAERDRLESHPALGVDAVLKQRQFNEGTLKRIRVLCEHHRPATEGSSFHPYSKIIAVAETFDALTSRRPYRGAYLPSDAVRVLISLAGTRLDRETVYLFVQALGLHPVGSYVQLSSGEKGIVFRNQPEALRYSSPVIRIVRDAQDKTVEEPWFVDLSPGVLTAGSTPTITRSLDPHTEGINVSGYLYAEADLKQTT